MRRPFITAALLLVLVVGGSILAIYQWYRSGGLVEFVADKALEEFAEHQTADLTATSTLDQNNLVHRLLGYDRPQTYLFLFLNNTELRPGGGFIGVYAAITMERGHPQVLKVEGSESLDNAAPDFVSIPPPPLSEYLKIKRWSFRDSNWSPDFAASSKKSLDLYAKEGGVKADEITTVVGFTPTLIEEFLKISGPIEYDGITFDSQRFTEQLEYEVEYGYAKRGIPFSERKKIMGGLTTVFLQRLAVDAFRHWPEYLALLERMLQEKQLVFFSVAPELQEAFVAKQWAGEMLRVAPEYDYLLWVDANLGALKTDWAIERSLSYQLVPMSTSTYRSVASMHYRHTASLDWRTSRYRTYARIFVPRGSRLIRAFYDVNGTVVPVTNVDSGTEGGWDWFGTTMVVEPRNDARLSFEYVVAPAVTETVVSGSYHVLLQKQIGTVHPKLTLDLDFGTPVLTAAPAEVPHEHGDGRYRSSTDLRVDREFTVSLQPRRP